MSAKDALLRTLAFHHVLGHAPTRPEWIMTCECDGDVSREKLYGAIDGLVAAGDVHAAFGRYAFDSAVIFALREREMPIPRKRRVARLAARWLASLSSVRFVALCNTTALGHAAEGGDLDFFVVVRAGTVMTTRFLAASPYKLLRRRPLERDRDAICLSYFISDAGLDLATHMLAPDDPYYRYWFLSLLPLYDDGIGTSLWNANGAITRRHPHAVPWAMPSDLSVSPTVRLPVVPCFESALSRFQIRAFPPEIRETMNRDSRVIVSPLALKFHTNDRREAYRSEYDSVCRKYGISV